VTDVSAVSGGTSGLAVTVVVPTRDSSRTLERCLESLRAQTARCRVVVVDGASRDGTVVIARRLADEVIETAPSRTAQRNRGAFGRQADVVGFIDSDMVVEPGVVAEAAAAIRAGAASVVVPESSFGTTYWARVRAYERSFYVGEPVVEAARFFRWDVLRATGGFDERLTAAEDTDLTRRAGRLGPVGRTESMIRHDDGALGFVAACRKKAAYADGLLMYSRLRGARALTALLTGRPFVRRPWILARRPLLGSGVIALKAGESAAVLAQLGRNRLLHRRAAR